MVPVVTAQCVAAAICSVSVGRPPIGEGVNCRAHAATASKAADNSWGRHGSCGSAPGATSNLTMAGSSLQSRRSVLIRPQPIRGSLPSENHIALVKLTLERTKRSPRELDRDEYEALTIARHLPTREFTL
jgi:hypothetical protein